MSRRYDLHNEAGEVVEEFTAPYALINQWTQEMEDGACRRGVGTLINHSPQRLANAQFYFDPDTRALIVVASKRIRNGSEIKVYYGRDYTFDPDTSHDTVTRRR